jgi:putative ABC transport system substrate-binding protein
MKRRDMMLRTLAVLPAPGIAIAQPAKKPARVGWLGWLGDTSPNPSAALEALRAGLAELGWKEGDNLVLEVRGGDREQGGALTAELVRANVDVIVAHGPMVFFARPHSGAIPLVFQINGDAVEAGLVASIARPGGHLTGISALSVELAGKRLEMLKNVQPAIKRVAVIANDRHPGRRTEQQASQEAAARLGIEVKYFPVVAPADFGAAFESIVREDASALLAFPDTLINRQAKAIAEFAIGRRLASISGWAEFAHAGNLMSYGPNHRDFFRHTATFVDRILKGAKPGDLPVEQPTKFEFVVNLKTAKALGLAVPQSILLRADEVIQ